MTDIDNNLPPEPTPPVLSDEEQTLENIRIQEDCVEQIFYTGADMHNVIDYIQISSVTLGQTVIQKYNYELVQGGYACKSTELIIK
jgi:hypothetical protein